MNKLNEEESKLRQKSNLEIGTWSNELAQQEAEQKAKQKAKKNNNNAKNNWEKGPSPEEIDEMEMEMLDLNVALPDNLTFLDESILPQVDPEGEIISDFSPLTALYSVNVSRISPKVLKT